MPAPEPQTSAMEAPPFLYTWPNVYAAVLAGLAVLLVVLWVLTQWFRY